MRGYLEYHSICPICRQRILTAVRKLTAGQDLEALVSKDEIKGKDDDSCDEETQAALRIPPMPGELLDEMMRMEKEREEQRKKEEELSIAAIKENVNGDDSSDVGQREKDSELEKQDTELAKQLEEDYRKRMEEKKRIEELDAAMAKRLEEMNKRYLQEMEERETKKRQRENPSILSYWNKKPKNNSQSSKIVSIDDDDGGGNELDKKSNNEQMGSDGEISLSSSAHEDNLSSPSKVNENQSGSSTEFSSPSCKHEKTCMGDKEVEILDLVSDSP